MMDSDLDSNGGFVGDNPYPSTQPAAPSWLNGGIVNDDGTITMPNGYVIPAPPPGYSRNPDNGQLTADAGTAVPTQGQLPNGSVAYPAATAPPPTTDQTGLTGGGGAGSYGQGGAGGGFSGFPTFNPSIYQAGPQFSPGQYTPPAPFSYGDFSYGDFKAPTLAEAQNQPGYQFALQQGQKALENSAAARGVLRTGGTLKDLFSWGDKFGEQNYGNVFNQDLQGYSTNRANAFDTYNTNRNNAASNYAENYGISKNAFDTNYGVQKDAWSMNDQQSKDVYDRLFQAQSAQFNPSFQAASLQFSDLYNRDRDKLNALTSIAGYGA